jgi:hypothetical protein
MSNGNSKPKICSFTQTYSDEREELFDFHDNDNVDLYFRNKLDDNFYVFHNCSENYINKIQNKKYLNSIAKKQIMPLNNITYTKSLLKTLSLIKTQGFKYIFFLQDDVFCMADNQTIDNLLSFVENNDFNLLNIEINNVNNEKEIIFEQSNLKVYNTDSVDFTKKNMWAMDDGPFVANIDYLMSVIYDTNYFALNDIWTAETYMNSKITQNPVQRLSTNTSFFIRVNIVGKNNLQARESHIELLKKTFASLNI